MPISTTIDDTFKGFPGGAAPVELADVGGLGWHLLRGDVPTPVAVLKEAAIGHNSRWMRRFVELAGATISPHGKTTMSPQLFQRQLDDGAWGITVATVGQLRICRAHGIQRVLMANQLLGRQEIRYVLEELAQDPGFDFYCLVDSVAGVEALAEAVAAAPGRPLQVLLEGGMHGCRTGCRGRAAAEAVVAAIGASQPHLTLRGIEGYEGVIKGADPDETLARIEAFLEFLGELLDTGLAADWFGPGEVILTAGGSAFYDLVTDRFATPTGAASRVRVVLRGGCYLTHDSHQYEELDRRLRARSNVAREAGPGLQPALEVWGRVQSMPEAGLALVTMGKRDVSFDIALPMPRRWARPGQGARAADMPPGHRITALNDQHAYMAVPADTPLRIGDLVGCGISHPCTCFDRWQLLYLVDDDYAITGAVRTYF